ncbi:MAG: prepilin peptidase [Oscillospiraceae bacterium]|nr:prepilin peptidase [Oscillospiraceae bacterium]
MNIESFEVVMDIGTCVMAFLFGITIGSFLNVAILRLPAGESLTKKNSHCMTCGAEILHRDLVPLFSWLILGGKCRACKAPISPRYSIVEALTGVLFVLIFVKYDLVYDGFFYPACLCLFLAGLIVLAFQDIDNQEMCVSVLIYTLIIAVIARVFSLFALKAFRGNDVQLIDGIIGLFSVSVPMLLIGFVITPLVYKLVGENHKAVRRLKKRLRTEKLSSKEEAKLKSALDEKLTAIKENGPVYGFGMGDVLMMAAGGLMLGWKACVIAVFIATILGAVTAVIMKLVNKSKGVETESAFAFGPFLAVGLAFSTYLGTEVFDLYVSALTVPTVM